MPRRRARLVLVCALLASGMGGGWLWLRSSPLVAVEHVRVSGLHGPDARAIATALAGAARQMSTLHMNPATLRAAVASFPVVRSVRAIPSFPHSLRIEVSEQLPVAALTIDGARTAVAADGVVLGPALLSGSLPTLSGADAAEPLVGQHLKDQSLLAELTALGAAPAPLEKLIARVFSSTGNDGLTVAMRNGLLVYFGDASRPHAKWLSLVRVLADPSSAGATYIDVRLPERPDRDDGRRTDAGRRRDAGWWIDLDDGSRSVHDPGSGTERRHGGIDSGRRIGNPGGDRGARGLRAMRGL